VNTSPIILLSKPEDEIRESPWSHDRLLIVVSSDLSHQRPYEEARRLDQATATAIEQLHGEVLGSNSACGRYAIAGLLHTASRHGLICRTVDLRSSGDTAGPRERVVGYGSWVFLSPTDQALFQERVPASSAS
jgi:AmmeMemoRadiSam system protein B